MTKLECSKRIKFYIFLRDEAKCAKDTMYLPHIFKEKDKSQISAGLQSLVYYSLTVNKNAAAGIFFLPPCFIQSEGFFDHKAKCGCQFYAILNYI